MGYFVALPSRDPVSGERGPEYLDIVDGATTAVQRGLRRTGLSGFAPTCTALLTAFARQRPGFTFFDVGANVGIYSSLCSVLFEPATVVAFEPTPSTAAVTRQIAAANGLDVVVEQTAVASAPGTATLQLSATSDASNSLREGFKRSVGTIDVPVTSIDRYVSETGTAPSVMKVDVESLEAEVVTGAAATIREHRPLLVVEVSYRSERDYGAELDQLMDEFDYCYYRLVESPTWKPREKIRSTPKSPHRDWLLAPQELDDGFVREYQVWAEALSRCTPALNLKVRQPAPEEPPHQRGGLGSAIRRLVRSVTER